MPLLFSTSLSIEIYIYKPSFFIVLVFEDISRSISVSFPGLFLLICSLLLVFSALLHALYSSVTILCCWVLDFLFIPVNIFELYSGTQ